MSIFVTQLQQANIYKIDIEGDKYTDFIYESIKDGNINVDTYKYLFKWFFDIVVLNSTQVPDLLVEINDFIQNIDSIKSITKTYKIPIVEHFSKIQNEVESAVKNRYYLQIFLC